MDRVEEFIMYSLRDSALPNYHRDRNSVDFPSAFDSFIEVDISGENKVEVPACFTNFVVTEVGKCDTLVMPILAPVTAMPRRLIRGILSDFMNPRSSGGSGFAYCKTSAGDYYYGLPGIILNGDKEPLMVMTLEINYEIENRHAVFTPVRYICHVSPKVFMNQDKLVEKTIIKKIIPFCSTKVMDRRDIARNSAYSEMRPFIIGTTIKVVIDDCSGFLVKPVVPSPSVNINQELNKLIADNISEIIGNDS